MNEAIQKFVFNEKQVRVVMRNDEPWFVAKDVCDILELVNSRKAIEDLDEDEKGVTIGDTLGGAQKMNIVSEPGLYKLVFNSKKPEAKKFSRWVAHEVLPSIRKHGAYMTDRTLAIMKDDPDYIYKVAEMLVEEKRQRMIAEGERDEAVRTKAWISERREATALQRNSVLKRQINRLEREKQEIVDDYDNRIDDLKDRLVIEEYDACRYRDWRSKVGRKPKGYVRPEDDMTDYLL